jgi:hypothetical protein
MATIWLSILILLGSAGMTGDDVTFTTDTDPAVQAFDGGNGHPPSPRP